MGVRRGWEERIEIGGRREMGVRRGREERIKIGERGGMGGW